MNAAVNTPDFKPPAYTAQLINDRVRAEKEVSRLQQILIQINAVNEAPIDVNISVARALEVRHTMITEILDHGWRDTHGPFSEQNRAALATLNA